MGAWVTFLGWAEAYESQTERVGLTSLLSQAWLQDEVGPLKKFLDTFLWFRAELIYTIAFRVNCFDANAVYLKKWKDYKLIDPIPCFQVDNVFLFLSWGALSRGYMYYLKLQAQEG